MLKQFVTKALAAKRQASKALATKSPVAHSSASESASRSVRTAAAIRKLLFALLAIGIGVLIGTATVLPRESMELISSIFVMGLFLLIALHHPLGGFLLWLFLTTFIDTWIEIPLGQGVPDLSFGRFAVFAITLSLVMRVTTHSLRLVPLSATDLFALLVPIAISLSAPLSVEPIATVQTAISLYLIPLAGFLLAKQLIRNRTHLDWLLGVIALFGVIAGTYTIYESLTGNVLFLAKDQEVGRLVRGETNLRLITGLVGETGAMGRVLAITLLTTLYYLVEHKNAYFKPFWIMAAFAQFGGLIVTYSRTPLLTFLVGLFILQFCYPNLRRVLLVLTMVVAVSLAANWQQIQRTEVAQDRLSRIEDANGRTSRWETGLNMWLQKPIRGWGIGRFGEMSGLFRADGSRQNIDAVENDYLLILVGTGLMGFLPYALFLLTTLTSGLRLYFQRKVLAPAMFIHAGTLALFGAVMSCFLLSSFTAVNSVAITRLLPFVLSGAIVGSHQYLLVSESNRQWSLSTRAASIITSSPRS